MYILHEAVAQRGSLEVTSYILKGVQTKFSPLVKPRERTTVKDAVARTTTGKRLSLCPNSSHWVTSRK